MWPFPAKRYSKNLLRRFRKLIRTSRRVSGFRVESRYTLYAFTKLYRITKSLFSADNPTRTWGDPTPRTCLLLVYNEQCDGKFVNVTCIRQQAKMRKPRIYCDVSVNVQKQLKQCYGNVATYATCMFLLVNIIIHVTFTNVPSHCSL